MRPISWIQVGPGRVALWPRPKSKYIDKLKDSGCTRVVTLLSEREDALQIGQAVEGANLNWTWLPLRDGQPPVGRTKSSAIVELERLSRYLDQGESVLIHCAAGIHRTGMIVYALLRLRGYSEAEALELISSMRTHTSLGIRQKHIEWGNQLTREAGDLERLDT
jgi:protein-tyrosine phosphatase